MTSVETHVRNGQTAEDIIPVGSTKGAPAYVATNSTLQYEHPWPVADGRTQYALEYPILENVDAYVYKSLAIF